MLPLVSAILPTKGRKEWAAQALQRFLAQTYPAKELIIVDDPSDPSFKPEPYIPNYIFTFTTGGTGSIPYKRNIACGLAKGQIICHFDSDDWSAPTRMADQVKLLIESGKAVTGFHSLLFHDEQYNQWFKYVGTLGFNALGTSLVYRKSFWEGHRFNEHMPIGEDNEFVKAARDAGELITVDGGFLQYARIHPGNTSVKKPGGETIEYRPIPLSALPEGFLK